jgi:DNA-binding NarL/FixJ family response regulator
MDRESAPVGSRDPIQLVLVDDHPLIRAGVRTMLENDWGMEVIAETDTIDAALTFCRQRRPNVVLMDLDLPAPGLMQGVQRLRRECSDCAVVILAHRADDEDLFQAVMAGASGHIVDDAQPAELFSTIRRAADGEEPISEVIAERPTVSERVLEAFRQLAIYGPSVKKEGEPVPLTARQLTVLRYVAEGLTNRQIARAMGYSEHTIKAEMSAILAELCLKHRTEAVVHAVRRGWISLPDPDGDGPH